MRPRGSRIFPADGGDFLFLQFHMWFGLPLAIAVGLHILLLGTELGPYPDSHAAFWVWPVWITAMVARWWGWMGIWVDGDDVVVRNMFRTVRLPAPVRAFKARTLWMSLAGGDCVVLGSSVTGRRCKATATGGDDRGALKALDEAGVLDGSLVVNYDIMLIGRPGPNREL